MSEFPLKIGMIGLDTSHATAFTELLNRTDHPFHIPGGRVVAAFPGGSPDFELSYSRVQGFTNTLSGDYGVTIMDSIEQVAESSDAILLESVDGRVHLEQFLKIAPYGKPVFVDKPLAVTSAAAVSIAAAAERYQVPVMSSSALRYAEGLTEALQLEGDAPVIHGMDCSGPMAIQPTQPGLFWYGVHMVDMLYAGMGRGCKQVTAVSSEKHDVVAGVWEDGRIGTVRGNRTGNSRFGAVIHHEEDSTFVDVYAYKKPYYASLLERIMNMFKTGKASIDMAETLEVIRFMEAANESRETGRTVCL